MLATVNSMPIMMSPNAVCGIAFRIDGIAISSTTSIASIGSDVESAQGEPVFSQAMAELTRARRKSMTVPRVVGEGAWVCVFS